jgi:hypothetical protein
VVVVLVLFLLLPIKLVELRRRARGRKPALGGLGDVKRRSMAE